MCVSKTLVVLLIVPCGIETTMLLILISIMKLLLIVPCGIETKVKPLFVSSLQLLIVPCGIETYEQLAVARFFHSFNRTLWN